MKLSKAEKRAEKEWQKEREAAEELSDKIRNVLNAALEKELKNFPKKDLVALAGGSAYVNFYSHNITKIAIAELARRGK